MRLERLLPPPLTSWTFAVAFALFALFGGNIMQLGGDGYWHLLAGKMIVELGQLPETDPLAYAVQDYRWYNISWLFDVLYWELYRFAGFDGITVFCITIASCMVALATDEMKHRGQSSEQAIKLVAALAGLSMLPALTPRPHLFTYLFSLLFARYLHRQRETKQARIVWLLPILMVLWVNLHGGFLAALPIFAVYFLDALIQKDYARAKIIFLSGALSVAATALNPYGIWVYEGAMRSLDSVVTATIQEWQPFDYASWYFWGIYLTLFTLASNLKEPDSPLTDKLLAVVWMMMSLYSVRHFPIFVLVAAPYFAVCLDRMMILRTKIVPPMVDSLPKRRMAAAAVAVSMLLVSLAIQFHPVHSLKQGKAYISAEASDWLKAHMGNKRVFNDPDLGGYMMWIGLPVFSDGRWGTVYPEDTIADVLKVTDLDNGWEGVLKKYRIDAMVVLNKTPLGRVLAKDQEWNAAYRDEELGVYFPRSAP